MKIDTFKKKYGLNSNRWQSPIQNRAGCGGTPKDDMLDKNRAGCGGGKPKDDAVNKRAKNFMPPAGKKALLRLQDVIRDMKGVQKDTAQRVIDKIKKDDYTNVDVMLRTLAKAFDNLGEDTLASTMRSIINDLIKGGLANNKRAKNAEQKFVDDEDDEARSIKEIKNRRTRNRRADNYMPAPINKAIMRLEYVLKDKWLPDAHKSTVKIIIGKLKKNDLSSVGIMLSVLAKALEAEELDMLAGTMRSIYKDFHKVGMAKKGKNSKRATNAIQLTDKEFVTMQSRMQAIVKEANSIKKTIYALALEFDELCNDAGQVSDSVKRNALQDVAYIPMGQWLKAITALPVGRNY
jgi:hypothetical protein